MLRRTLCTRIVSSLTSNKIDLNSDSTHTVLYFGITAINCWQSLSGDPRSVVTVQRIIGKAVADVDFESTTAQEQAVGEIRVGRMGKKGRNQSG
jgi:hypothetical protein